MAGVGSEMGVRKVLERLGRQGVVISEPAGRARLYRLNRNHLAAPYIEGLATLHRELFTRLRERIGDWLVPAVYAAVFGSVSIGRATADSDLDLFIVRAADITADNPKWREQIDALTQDATAWTGNDARVLEYGEDELAHIDPATEPVLADIRRDALTLAGDPDVLGRGWSGR